MMPGVGKPGGDLGGDIILGLGIQLGLGGGVLVIAGPVAGGGVGAARAVDIGGDGVALEGGGEERVIKEHEVWSEGWAVPGLERLALGDEDGDWRPLTGVATTSAACPGPAVMAPAACSGNSLAAS